MADFFVIYYDTDGTWKVKQEVRASRYTPIDYDQPQTAFDSMSADYATSNIKVVKDMELTDSYTWTDPPWS